MKVVTCESIQVIIDDLKNDFFSILIDEYQDVSVKEKTIVILCYVDKKGLSLRGFFYCPCCKYMCYVFKVNTRDIIDKIHFKLVKISLTRI